MVFLNPTNDVAFKKLFGDQNQKDILINFLNNILERPEGKKITQVTFNDPYNHPETQDSKLSIVDVSATDEQGKHYIVEVQVSNQQDYGARAQYYSSLAVARQLDSAGKYAQLTPVIFVGVLAFNLFKGENYLSHHLVLDTITKSNELRLMEWHFIELEKFEKTDQELQEDTDKWVYLLKNAKNFKEMPEKLKERKVLYKALEILNKATWSDRELYDYDKRRDEVLSEQSKLETAMAEGIALGEREAFFKMARILRATNMSVQEIARVTGLSIDEIKKLS